MKLVTSLILLVLCGFGAHAQTITPQVLNAAGDHRQIGTSGIWVTDNVGEPFTETLSNNIGDVMITQGFIQPDVVTQAGFTLTPFIQHLLCMDKPDDAFISLSLASTIDSTKYKATYYWSPPEVCPTNDCSKIDTLKAGVYSVTVAISYSTNTGAVRFDTIPGTYVVNNASSPCVIHPFSGVSPNGDGKNDFFEIENIQEFPNNRVTIYNRWGGQLADIKGYDQTKEDKRWPTTDEASKLSSSTYFYIIELEPGKKPVKGWVELIKN